MQDIEMQEESAGEIIKVRNPHREWVVAEGIPYVEEFAVDLMTQEFAPWPRLGVNGAVIKLDGSGDFLDLWAIELPPMSSTTLQRHLFEEVVYVVTGHGSTSITVGGRERTFEWGPRSMFVIPLNAPYRHFNLSGSERAVLGSTTSFPLSINAFHDGEFVFGDSYDFFEPPDATESFTGDGKMFTNEHGNNLWTTNFVPDLGIFEKMWQNEHRGSGSTHVVFDTSTTNMHFHMSEVPVGRYKRAHRHRAGFHIFPVGEGDERIGYSLLWPEIGDEMQRVNWSQGTVFVPPDLWWHQHFNVNSKPARYLACAYGSSRFPFGRGSDSGNGSLNYGQIPSDEESPEIMELFEKEAALAGVATDM